MKEKIIGLLLVVFLILSVPSVALGDSADGMVLEKENTESEDVADVPALTIGDSWTYRRNITTELEQLGTLHLLENFTYTVDSIETYTFNNTEHYGYNLSLEGEVIEGNLDIDRFSIDIHSGDIDGYLFLRMSDLGVVADYEWRKAEGNLTIGDPIDEEYAANLTQETLIHDDPTVERYDFPIDLGGEFSLNTTQWIKNYMKFESEELENREVTSQNHTNKQQTLVTSSSKEDVSVPAGDFSTYELEETERDEGSLIYNYAPEVKRNVKSEEIAPDGNTEIDEDLLEYDVAERNESLSISPRSGRPGDEVTVSGSFPNHAGEDIRIRIPYADEEYTVTADQNGEFSKDIEVPFVSDHTDDPEEMGSLGVIAEVQNNPKEAYAVSTLEVEGVANVEVVSPEEDDLILESNVTVEWDSEFTDYHEVRVNEGDWEDVGTDTSHTFTLDDGEHTIEVKAVEELEGGETYSETDAVNITFDATPPKINITSPQEGEIIPESEVTIEWMGEGGTVPIKHYVVSINGGNWIQPKDPLATSYTFTDLDDGEHTVEVRGQDEEGRNSTESVSFQVETEPKITKAQFSVMPKQGSVPLDVNITAEIENEGYVDGMIKILESGETIHEETIPAREEINIKTNYTFEEAGNKELKLQDGQENILDSETVKILDVYELTINTEGEGTTDPSADTHTYADGEEVTIHATAEEGWYLDGWTGDYEDAGEKITITMDEDMEITAHFKAIEYDLTIKIDGEGSTNPSEGTHTYKSGEEVNITATAADGWSFKEWTGTEGTGDNITVTMDEDKEITVSFEEDDGDGGGGIPGFTLPLVVLGTLIAVAFYHKKNTR